MMAIEKKPRTSVGANDTTEHPTPAHCRGRLIAPTADLSALMDVPLSGLF